MSATTGSIPASALVNVLPGVLNAGGAAIDLNGLYLTNSWRVSVGQVLSFATPASVGAYFGLTSNEYTLAQKYSAGFTGCTALPGAMLFAQFNPAAVGAYLKSGSVASLTLAQLQAISGALSIEINGTNATSSNISLSAATSFSSAAAIILAAFTSPTFTVAYDSTSGSFIVQSSTTGVDSTIAFATGTAAASLLMTAATGAVLSQGAAAATPATFMPGIVALTQNWASFSYTFNPDVSGENTVKLAFAQWASAQNNRYALVAWDNDIQATEQNNTENLGYLIQQQSLSGTILVYEPGNLGHAAFVMGYAASLNFGATNGRSTLAYRTQAGLVASVSNQQIAANLQANGYNFVGAYATANQAFTFMQNGQISGEFLWADSFFNQIWLNSQMQLALMELETNVGTIPYNTYGKTLIQSALIGTPQAPGPIDQAITFGAIVAGTTLSASQVLEIDNAAGVTGAAQAVATQGYYLMVGTASPQVQAQRGSPPITLWYADGESIQNITMNSIDVE